MAEEAQEYIDSIYPILYELYDSQIPEMLSQLQLPYDDEYKLALTMHKPSKS